MRPGVGHDGGMKPVHDVSTIRVAEEALMAQMAQVRSCNAPRPGWRRQRQTHQ